MNIENFLNDAKHDGIITLDQYNTLSQRIKPVDTEENIEKAASSNPEGLEAFQFVSNLSDWFIAAGLILFFSTFYALFSSEDSSAHQSIIPSLISLALAWGLSEYIAGKRRLTLPSMTMLFFVCLPLYELIDIWLTGSFLNRTLLASSMGVGLGAALFFIRFRLPFALLPLTFSVIYLVLFAYIELTQKRTFLIFEPVYYTLDVVLLLFVLGLITFIIAMVFDIKDPLRRTSDSARAFWLHLIASPILIHVVAINLIVEGSRGLFLLIPYLAGYTFLALLIDRRAGVLSAIFYLGASLTYIANTSNSVGASLTTGVVLPGFLSATAVLIISLFWSSLRRPLVKAVLNETWQKRLPPTA